MRKGAGGAESIVVRGLSWPEVVEAPAEFEEDDCCEVPPPKVLIDV